MKKSEAFEVYLALAGFSKQADRLSHAPAK